MQEVPAGPDIELDHAGQDCVGNQPSKHRPSEHSWELAAPDEDDWDQREGRGGDGTDYVDVAGGHVQDSVPEVQAGGKEGGLAAEQHLVGPLQQSSNESVTSGSWQAEAQGGI